MDAIRLFLLSLTFCFSFIDLMKKGIVIRNVADLRSGADFHSERKSQLLYNETLTVEGKAKGYLKIRLPDGYYGWIDERAVSLLSNNEYRKIGKALNYRVKALTAKIYHRDKSNATAPPYLFYGTKIRIKSRKGRLGYVDDNGGGTDRIALKKIEKILNEPIIKGRQIVNDCRRLLGTPYLWGGKTPFGIDCSGLTQIVYGRHGIVLPRDSKDQRGLGEKVDRNDIKSGDLLFFKGHVAIAVDRRRIIHASLAEGGVAVNSLFEEDSVYRKDLDKGFLEARRVL